MKIIHCLNQYMPLAMAGTEVYVQTLGTMQKLSGHEVAVITPHIDHYRPGQIKDHYVYEEMDVYQYLESGDPLNRQVHYGNKKPAGLENFKLLVSKLKPGIIHFHELNRSIGLTVEHVKIAKQFGAKVILTAHLSSYTCNTNVLVKNGQICDGKIDENICTGCSYKVLFNIPSIIATPLAILSSLFKRVGVDKNLPEGKVATLLKVPVTIERIKNELKELAENLDQFVCYAKWYKNILLENGVPESKITVVPTALVNVKKSEFDQPLFSNKLPIRMVFIGRIQYTKGIHLIIEAIRHFSNQQVQIDLYGMDEDTAYYHKCRNDSKVVNNIVWKGRLNRADVLDCLTQYDIFCLASTFSEMSPLVIQESFAAGIPVLASKVYGNIEQIKHQHNGLLFEFNSIESLREKIKLLVLNPDLIQRMKANIVIPLDFEKVNEAYLGLYASL